MPHLARLKWSARSDPSGLPGRFPGPRRQAVSVAELVTDHGGALSHPSIVAREFGIPAVVGTGCATAKLVTGQSVTVDGTTGRVEPAP